MKVSKKEFNPLDFKSKATMLKAMRRFTNEIYRSGRNVTTIWNGKIYILSATK